METKKQKLEKILTYILIGCVALVTLFAAGNDYISKGRASAVIGVLGIYLVHLLRKKHPSSDLEELKEAGFEVVNLDSLSEEEKKKRKILMNLTFGLPVLLGPVILYIALSPRFGYPENLLWVRNIVTLGTFIGAAIVYFYIKRKQEF